MSNEALVVALQEAWEAGNVDVAVSLLDQLANLEPEAARWPFNKGVLYEQVDEIDLAMHAYRDAVERDPSFADAWVNLGRHLDDRCDWDQALICYDQALQTQEGRVDPIAWSNRGNTLLSMGRFEEALISFEAALELEPGGPQLRGKQTALGWLGRIDDANALQDPSDPNDRGELVQHEALLADGRKLAVRYWVGLHTAPEQLDQVCVDMLDFCASLESTEPGLADGITIQFGWSMLLVQERDGVLVLCEPAYAEDPWSEWVWDVGFTLQTMLMQQMLLGIVDAEPDDCVCFHGIGYFLEAFENETIALRRMHGVDQDGFSGWYISTPDDAVWNESLDFADLQTMRTGDLVHVNHHFIKALLLPRGYKVVFRGHEIVSIVDPDGNERWAEG